MISSATLLYSKNNVVDVNWTLSYLLDKVNFILEVVSPGGSMPPYILKKQDIDEKNKPNGYAGLDSLGKIDSSLLSFSGLNYRGLYNTTLNSPNILNVSSINNLKNGDFFRVGSSGQITLPNNGLVSLNPGDLLIYDGVDWALVLNQDSVLSVNNKKGIVELALSDIVSNLKDVDYSSSNNIIYKINYAETFLSLAANPSLTDTLDKIVAAIKDINNDMVRPSKFVLSTGSNASTPISNFIVDNASGKLRLDSGTRTTIIKDDLGLNNVKNLDYSNPDNIFIKLAAQQPSSVLNSPVTTPPTDPTLTNSLDEIIKTLNLCARSNTKINNIYSLANDFSLTKSDIGLGNVLNIDCSKFSNIKLDTVANLDANAADLSFSINQTLGDVVNILLTKIKNATGANLTFNTSLSPPSSLSASSIYDSATNTNQVFLSWLGFKTNFNGNINKSTSKYDTVTNTLTVDVPIVQVYESDTSLFKLYVGDANDLIADKQNKLILEQKPNSHVSAIQFPTDDSGDFNLAISQTNLVQINKASIRLDNVKNVDCSITDNINCISTSFTTDPAATFFQPNNLTSISLTEFLKTTLAIANQPVSVDNQSTTIKIDNDTTQKKLTLSDIWNRITTVNTLTFKFPASTSTNTPAVNFLHIYSRNCTVTLNGPVGLASGDSTFLFVSNKSMANVNFVTTTRTFLLLKSTCVFVYSADDAKWDEWSSSCEPFTTQEYFKQRVLYTKTKSTTTALISRFKLATPSQVEKNVYNTTDLYGPCLDTNIFPVAEFESFTFTWTFNIEFNEILHLPSSPAKMIFMKIIDQQTKSSFLEASFEFDNVEFYKIKFQTPSGSHIARGWTFGNLSPDYSAKITIQVLDSKNITVLSDYPIVNSTDSIGGVFTLDNDMNIFTKFLFYGPCKIRNLLLKNDTVGIGGGQTFSWSLKKTLKIDSASLNSPIRNLALPHGQQLLFDLQPIFESTINGGIIMPRLPSNNNFYNGSVYSPTNDAVIFAPAFQLSTNNIHYYQCNMSIIVTVTLENALVSNWLFCNGTFNWLDNAIYFGLADNYYNWTNPTDKTAQVYMYMDCSTFSLKELDGVEFAPDQKFVNCIYSRQSEASLFIPGDVKLTNNCFFIKNKKLVTASTWSSPFFAGKILNGVSDIDQKNIFLIPGTSGGLLSTKWPKFTADSFGFLNAAECENNTGNQSSFQPSAAHLSLVHNQIFILPETLPTAYLERWLYVDCDNNSIVNFLVFYKDIADMLVSSTSKFDMPYNFLKIASSVYIPPIDSILILIDYFQMDYCWPVSTVEYATYRDTFNYVLPKNTNGIVSLPQSFATNGVVVLPATSNHKIGDVIYYCNLIDTASSQQTLNIKTRGPSGSFSDTVINTFYSDHVVLRLENISQNITDWVYLDSFSLDDDLSIVGYKLPLLFSHLLLNCSTKEFSYVVVEKDSFEAKNTRLTNGTYLNSGKIVFSPNDVGSVACFDFGHDKIYDKFTLYKSMQ